MRVQTLYNVNDVFYYLVPKIEQGILSGYDIKSKRIISIKTESTKFKVSNNSFRLRSVILYCFDDGSSVSENRIDDDLFYCRRHAEERLKMLKEG